MTATEARRRPDYSLCGWRFRSEIPIAALPDWDGDPDRPADIELVRGHVEDVPCDDLVGVVVTGRGEATVVAVDVGCFAVMNGKRVVADVRPDALPGVVETMAVGPCSAR